jgi:hypothetical protein
VDLREDVQARRLAHIHRFGKIFEQILARIRLIHNACVNEVEHDYSDTPGPRFCRYGVAELVWDFGACRSQRTAGDFLERRDPCSAPSSSTVKSSFFSPVT